MKVLFIGTFSGSACGELVCNRGIYEGLSREHGVKNYGVLDTTLDDVVETPGKFGIYKLLRATKVIFAIFFVGWKYDVFFMTPGLSKLGILRFLPYIVVAKILGKSTVCHYHGRRFESNLDQFGSVLKRLVVLFFGKVDHHIFISDSLYCQRVGVHPIKDYSVLYNFLDKALVEYFQSTVNRKASNNGGLNILYLSNLIPEKGYLKVYDAFELFLGGGHLGTLTIVGKGSPERTKELTSRIRNSKYKDRITYCGPLYGSDKFEVMKKSDIMILPTAYTQEALPLVLLECMASSCVVMATGVGGIPDLIKDKINGVILEDNSPETIKKELVELDGNREELQEISEKASRNIVKYSYEHYLKEISRVLNSLL